MCYELGIILNRKGKQLTRCRWIMGFILQFFMVGRV